MNEAVKFVVLRNGADYAFLHPAKGSAPILRADSKSEIKMSLRGTFLADAYDADGHVVEVDWMNDEIKPVLTLDGTDYPLGIVIPTTIEQKRSASGRTMVIEAYDRCWRVKNTVKENLAYFAADSLYLDAVESLLTEAGLILVVKTASPITFPEAREDWDIGDSALKIINELLAEINYKQLWFDSAGAAVLEPSFSPTAENIQHVLIARKADPRNPKEVDIIAVVPGASIKTDVYSTPNVFVCVCSNADKASGMVAVAENSNPQSPLSIYRRGRRIAVVEHVNNIASQTELQAYADRKASESLLTGEEVSVVTTLQPGFGIGDITALQYDDIFSICVETSWTMTLAPGGTMTHNLEKVVLNLEQ